MPSLIPGVVELNSKYLYGHTSRNVPIYLFHPFDKTHPLVRVGCSQKDRAANLLALVEIDDTREKIYKGHIVKVLGQAGDFQAEAAALKWFAAPNHLKVEKLSLVSPLKDTASRLSILGGWTINIDPPGCRDIDDVVTLIPLEDGKWRLIITIADVAALVPEGSEMDILAYSQGQTVYQDGKAVAPMLPTWFSEFQGSLVAGETRLGLSWVGTWNPQEHRLEDKHGHGHFQETIVKNQETYTYESILETKSFPTQILKEIASYMKGALTNDPHEWVEELMLFYNKEVAKTLLAKGIGILRSQSDRQIEKATLYKEVHPDLAPYGLSAAEYSPSWSTCIHATLGVPYCHASSPLRRYADLSNQRYLKAILHGTEESPVPETILVHLNHRQKAIKQHDRDFFFLQQVSASNSGSLMCVYLEALETKDVVYVPAWKRLVRVPWRKEEVRTWKSGDRLTLEYYYNRNQPFWKERMVFCLNAPTYNK
jgi:exoribonuclease R